MITPDDGTRWWSVEEVAAKLQIPVRTVRYRARKGLIPGVKVGVKIWRFPTDVGQLCEKSGLWRSPSVGRDLPTVAQYRQRIEWLQRRNPQEGEAADV